MSPLTYARAQMGLSLAFHIVFAAAGVALPLFMVIADVLHLRTKDPDYLEISKRMAKGTTILFAVGAVSGTVLSFELGLLWPSFMGTFGDVIGLPFAMEGFAFFTEAIFLGIYLYGRGKISPRLHLFSGIAVAVSGCASAFFVTCVNACMNDPRGFQLENGRTVAIDPFAAMFSPPWAHETIHALAASYQATAFALAAVHAWVLLRHPTSALFRKALKMSLVVACATALIQPLIGDFASRRVAETQPAKLAAAEALFVTQRGAPLLVGGIPNEETGTVSLGIEIPYGLSLLAAHDPNAEVKGLDQVPVSERPPVVATHLAFQTMVCAGGAMALLALVTILGFLRKKDLFSSKWFLRAVVAAGPLGMIALEAGWLVTEFGRQPWIVRGHMRTAEAVTPFPHLAAPFWVFTIVYVLLGIAVVSLLFRQLRHTPVAAGDAATVGPMSLRGPASQKEGGA